MTLSFWLWAMQVFPRWRYAARKANEANKRMWQKHGPRAEEG